MTAAAIAASARDTLQRRPGAMVSLASVEARRLVVHPVYLAILGYAAITGSVDAARGFGNFTRTGVAEFLAILFIFYLPLLVIFAASLVATSARRAGTEDLLSALPVSARGRSVAVMLAGLAPATIGGLAALVAWCLVRGETEPSILQSGLGLLGTPLLYLGVTCLAVAAARWLPWPGVPVAVLVVLVVWVANARGSSHATAVLTAPWVSLPDDDRAFVIAGYSDLWHVAYLAGLVALAATAALYRDNLRRMVAVGVVVGAPTLTAAIAQLP
jgi:hypothetical protein